MKTQHYIILCVPIWPHKLNSMTPQFCPYGSFPGWYQKGEIKEKTVAISGYHIESTPNWAYQSHGHIHMATAMCICAHIYLSIGSLHFETLYPVHLIGGLWVTSGHTILNCITVYHQISHTTYTVAALHADVRGRQPVTCFCDVFEISMWFTQYPTNCSF